jgi:hypothetical protein
MSIRSPYHSRTKYAKCIFVAVLILLVNGWVDFANHSLRNVSWTHTYAAVVLDDYDTFYEWVAEDLFNIEDAIPEQEGDSDDTGKVVDIKVYFVHKQVALSPLPVITKGDPEFFYLLHQLKNLPVSIWDPPPNV